MLVCHIPFRCSSVREHCGGHACILARWRRGFKHRSRCWRWCLSPCCLLHASFLLSAWAPRRTICRRGTGCTHVFVPLIYLCLLLISVIVLVLCLLLVLAMAIAIILSFALVLTIAFSIIATAIRIIGGTRSSHRSL